MSNTRVALLLVYLTLYCFIFIGGWETRATEYRDSEWTPFPQSVLQTKASGSSLSSDVQRWRDGCIALNPDHRFDMFDDTMLLAFTKSHYPQYLSLFQALSGVCKYCSLID
jgi:mannosyltransferase OCH1-like enzyme